MGDLANVTAPLGMRPVSAYRLAGAAGDMVSERCWVVEEDALSIAIEGVGTYTLMWTPTEGRHGALGFTREDGLLAEGEDAEVLALALGFAFTEGIVDGLDGVETLAACAASPGVVRMTLVDPGKVRPRRRNVVMHSSCGICGGRDALEDILTGLSPVSRSLRLSARRFVDLMTTMRRRQTVFRSTGGAHAAAVFSRAGEIVASAEDLGRHNALDKVIGQCLLRRTDLAGHGVVLTSRLSLEMITKAVRAGFEIVAAVSAPSSYAIEVAERFGVTLCGFVRGEGATVYTHAGRIAELGAVPGIIDRQPPAHSRADSG